MVSSLDLSTVKKMFCWGFTGVEPVAIYDLMFHEVAYLQ